MNELVSILIPAYNTAKYINECVLSCINQDYRNLEICIVDDGSVDDTWELLKKLKEKYLNLKIHRFMKNKGKIAAFNEAFRMSSGTYIALMGSDDINYLDRISFSIEHIGDYDLCFFDLKRNINGEIENVSLMQKYFNMNSEKEVFLEELIRQPIVFGGTIFSKREAFSKVFPIDENLSHEDWWIPIKISEYGKVKYFPKVVLQYRIHARQSTSHRNMSYKKWLKSQIREIPYYRKIVSSVYLRKDLKDDILVKLLKIEIINEVNILKKLFLTHKLIKKLICIKRYTEIVKVIIPNRIKYLIQKM